MRKKVDPRVRTLIENGVARRERSLLVLIGDKARDQVVNLHQMLSRTVVKARPTVLWCYKKELYLSSHKRKRLKQLKKLMQRGLVDPEQEDPFAVFMASTQIRYCYYSETQNVLGNTYGMCVLQDFEAISPNLLARTVETVEGGGLIVLLLSDLNSLTQLYTLSMDVHSRLRTQSHQDVVGRFNERMVLSMTHNPNCLLMDDELNVLPTSTLMGKIRPTSSLAAAGDVGGKTEELEELCETLADTQPAGTLVSLCRTVDQAKSLITFLDSASEKTLRSTVALTASRGRGKSAALGLAISGALAFGYSNIFVTSPSPENLKTLFEFIVKGLDAMDYKEHIDYNLIESTNPELNKAIVRLDVFRQHRQTVQYVQPHHSSKIGQAELLVIDEAAAIPLPVVRALLGPYLVFLCSTVNGYEGTGRSLSLKLLKELRGGSQKKGTDNPRQDASILAHSRNFREITLDEPIRYAAGDPMEAWLHELLCLDAADHVPPLPSRLPHPDECELFYVSKDTLFSYHKATEKFLQQIMSLYVASHYKNTPNDILLMSDAPAHHLFVLLAPVDENTGKLPDVLCVLQVAFEGQISKNVSLAALAKGKQYHGDLIPWTISQHFQDSEFPKLSGARIVRIAAHPDITGGGYGSKAIELLKIYFEGGMQSIDDFDEQGGKAAVAISREPTEAGESTLLTETIAPKKGLPPLLISLEERPAESLQYLGVAYGLTSELFNFWRKNNYHPVYIRQSPSETTGENSCICIHPLSTSDIENSDWLEPFVSDFKTRFTTLLGSSFAHLHASLALSVIDPFIDFTEAETNTAVEKGVQLRKLNGQPLTPFDLKRLESFTFNLSEYSLVKDLVPAITAAYFSRQIPAQLSVSQAVVLLAMGLQAKTQFEVSDLLGLPGNQVRALLAKSITKIYKVIKDSSLSRIDRSLPVQKEVNLEAHEVTVDEDLNQAAAEALSLDKVGHYAIAMNGEGMPKSRPGKPDKKKRKVGSKKRSKKN